MEQEIFEDWYWEVYTSEGIQIVPCDVCASRAELPDYVEGEILRNNNGTIKAFSRYGWIARMTMPGYLDCTEWTAHDSYEEAKDYLTECYGD